MMCVSTVPIRSYRRNGIVFSSPTIGNGKAAKFIMATDKHKGKGMLANCGRNDVNDVHYQRVPRVNNSHRACLFDERPDGCSPALGSSENKRRTDFKMKSVTVIHSIYGVKTSLHHGRQLLGHGFLQLSIYHE